MWHEIQSQDCSKGATDGRLYLNSGDYWLDVSIANGLTTIVRALLSLRQRFRCHAYEIQKTQP